MTKRDLYAELIYKLTQPGSVRATVFTEHSLDKLIDDMLEVISKYNKEKSK